MTAVDAVESFGVPEPGQLVRARQLYASSDGESRKLSAILAL